MLSGFSGLSLFDPNDTHCAFVCAWCDRGPARCPLWGRMASRFTCENPFNYSAESSLPLLSPARLPTRPGTARRRARERGAKGRDGGMEGWIDEKERLSPKKHCCLITGSFSSAAAGINNPTAGAVETDTTPNTETRHNIAVRRNKRRHDNGACGGGGRGRMCLSTWFRSICKIFKKGKKNSNGRGRVKGEVTRRE